MGSSSPRGAWLSRLIVLSLLLSILSVLIQVQPAAAQDTTTQNRYRTVNVELILDSSGSMAQEISPGVTRIEAAKQVLRDVIEALPEQEGINVGFRVYGHKGNNTEAGKAESCQSSDLTVPIEGVNKEALRAQVETYSPVGWTPIALSLQRAAEDFPDAAEDTLNAAVLVTDGLETCQPPEETCNASRALIQGDGNVVTHVIGFALAQEERANLQCITQESGGLLLGAGSAEELSAALFQILEEVQVVVSNGFFEIEEIGGIFPFCTITGQGGATDSNPQGEQFTVLLNAETGNRIELAVGVYDVSWVNPSGQETRIRVNIEAGRTTFVRGSLLKFPQGAGEIYVLKDLAGVVLWQDQIEQGDYIWVLPSIYRLDLLELVGDPILISMEVQTLPGSATQIEVFTAP